MHSHPYSLHFVRGCMPRTFFRADSRHPKEIIDSKVELVEINRSEEGSDVRSEKEWNQVS